MKPRKLFTIISLVLALAAGPSLLVYSCSTDGDCSDWTPQGCLNGHLYDIKYICDDGSCIAGSTTDKGASAACDMCTDCKYGAWSLTSGSAIKYTFNFYNDYDDYVIDDSGVYVLPPGTKMDLTDIGEIAYMCGNGVPSGGKTPNLLVWVYNTSDSRKLSIAHNNIDIGNALDRSNVIGSSSDTCGTPILNPFVMLYQWGYMANTEINNIYTFNKPSKYTAFIDAITGWCGPNNYDDTYASQNYICPWLGGTDRSKICPEYTGEGYSEGWMPQENLNILVPDPDITIAAPSDEPDHNNDSYAKSWNINNTGLGKVSFTITGDCGGAGWNCAFVGYAKGSKIPLEMGKVYTVDMNITPNQTDTNTHQVGIIVTYDDGYGFTTIPSQIKASYITFGNSTTSVTTTTLENPIIA